VHIHREGASFYFFLSTFLAGAVCVRTVHNCFAFTGKLRLFRKFQRQLSAKLGMTYVTIGASVEENEKNAVHSYYDLSKKM
jgi:hypothetical protein